MSRLSALFFLVIMLAQSLYNSGVVLYWLSNQAFIAANLCENRSKPALHCDGKCYLKKKLAESPETPAGAQSPGKHFKKGIEQAELPEGILPLICTTGTYKNALIPQPCTCRSVFNADSIFHPPPVAA